MGQNRESRLLKAKRRGSEREVRGVNQRGRKVKTNSKKLEKKGDQAQGTLLKG